MKETEDKGMREKKLCFFSSFFRNIAFIAKNTKGVFVLEIVFFIVSGLLPPLNVAAIQLIISGAEKSLNGIAIALTGLPAGLILFGFVLFAQRMILLGQMPLSSVFQYRIKNQVDRLVVEKTISLPYAYIEDPSFQTRLAEVRHFAEKLPKLLFQTLSTFQSLLALILLSAHFQEQAWLIIPLALGQIPSFVLSLRISGKQHELDLRQIDGRRQQEYYLKLATNSPNVKEKMLFRLGGLFSDRWDKQTTELDREQVLFMKKQIGFKVGGDFFSLSAFSFCVVMLLLFPATDAARFVSLTAALLSIQSAFDVLISSISSLRGQVMDDQVVHDFLKSQKATGISKELLTESIKTISFKDVTFTYKNGSKPVLKNINVELKRGETVAIVGENGAGKTTFIKLLLGLYQPDSGYVLCNNDYQVCNLDRVSFFSHISAILQFFNRYPLTVAQNIDLFSEEGKEPNSQIIEAAKKSGVDTFIEQLPQKYQTRLTNIRENGMELSGGQWQRLAIARGIQKKADLFVMDEPTAALDPLMEAEILTQFLNMPGDALKLIVSHRIGVASKADRILVFREGCLEETGTHDELMLKNGYYAELYSTQAQWYQKEEEKDG